MRHLLIHAMTAPYLQQTPVDGAIRDTLGALLLALILVGLWASLLVRDLRRLRAIDRAKEARRRSQNEGVRDLQRHNDFFEAAMDSLGEQKARRNNADRN